MGLLQPNRDDLIRQLAGDPYSSPSSPSAPSAAPADKSPAAALGIASLLFNIGSWLGSNIWNDARVQRQNQQNLLQWQRETAYNSPAAQVQRLKVAGINPALAFANGSLTNEAAPSPQLAAAPVMSPVQFDPLTLAQIDNLKSQSEKNRSEIPVNEQRANELKSSIGLLNAQAKAAGLNNEFAEATLAKRIASQLAQDTLSEAQARANMKYVNEVVHAQYEEMLAKAEKAKNEQKISEKQYDIIQEELKQAQAKTSIAQYDESMKEFTYWFDKGSELLSHVENVIGLIARFKFLAPTGGSVITQEYFDEYGNPTGSSVRTSTPSPK